MNEVCKDCNEKNHRKGRTIGATSPPNKKPPHNKKEAPTLDRTVLKEFQSDGKIESETKENRKHGEMATGNVLGEQGDCVILRTDVVERQIIMGSEINVEKQSSGEGWVKTDQNPGWDIVGLAERKDHGVEEQKIKKYVKGKEGWVNVKPPFSCEDGAKVEEDPDWDIINTEEGVYQQGVDGWDIKTKDKTQYRE